MHVCMLSHVWLFVTTRTVALQVHRILQARIPEYQYQEYQSGFAISSPRGSSLPKDWFHISPISCIGSQILYHRATWEALYFYFFKQFSVLILFPLL